MRGWRGCSLPMAVGKFRLTFRWSHNCCTAKLPQVDINTAVVERKEVDMGLWSFVKETGSSWFGGKANADTPPDGAVIKAEMEKSG